MKLITQRVKDSD